MTILRHELIIHLEEVMRLLCHLFSDADFHHIELVTQLLLDNATNRFNLESKSRYNEGFISYF